MDFVYLRSLLVNDFFKMLFIQITSPLLFSILLPFLLTVGMVLPLHADEFVCGPTSELEMSG